MSYRNHRSKRRTKADGGSSWISYSDMMAALLLVFVLVLSYSLYQYFHMLETKTAELNEQAGLLAVQQDQLESQKAALLEQEKTLTSQEQTLAAQRQTLSDQQVTLEAQQATLNEQQARLDAQQATLSAQATELETQQLTLTAKQGELDSALSRIASQQTEIDTQKLSLEEKEALILAAQSVLSQKEAELSALQASLGDKQNLLDNATALLAEQQQVMAAQQQRLNSLVGVRTQIVEQLTGALKRSRINASVDPNTGDIMLESTVFFDVNKNKIKPEGQAFLDSFIPVYLGVLLQPEYESYLGEIIIEGHTDPTGTYLHNLELSQERALSVATYCLEMPGLNQKQLNKLQSILTATGRSFSSPIRTQDGEIDMDASRRVEFKFRLRDSEMIDDIRGILSGYQQEFTTEGGEQ